MSRDIFLTKNYRRTTLRRRTPVYSRAVPLFVNPDLVTKATEKQKKKKKKKARSEESDSQNWLDGMESRSTKSEQGLSRYRISKTLNAACTSLHYEYVGCKGKEQSDFEQRTVQYISPQSWVANLPTRDAKRDCMKRWLLFINKRNDASSLHLHVRKAGPRQRERNFYRLWYLVTVQSEAQDLWVSRWQERSNWLGENRKPMREKNCNAKNRQDDDLSRWKGWLSAERKFLRINRSRPWKKRWKDKKKPWDWEITRNSHTN